MTADRARPPWCPDCERFPGLVHPHEFFDPETLQPLTVAACRVTPPVRVSRPRRQLTAARLPRRSGVRRVAA